MKQMRSDGKNVQRFILYFIGLVILAFGLTLNTKTNLGVSPIISIPFCLSEIFDLNFANLTLLEYSSFVVAQFFVKGKDRKWYDILQIPLSLVFTRVMNLFGMYLPSFEDSIVLRFMMLAIAIICTGVGASLSMNMRLIANPADALVYAIAVKRKTSTGKVKNIFDICCVCICVVIGLALEGRIIGVGIGTLAAMLGIGRVIHLFDRKVIANLRCI